MTDISKNQSWRKTFDNALNGIKYAFGTQRNFKVHLVISILVFLLAIILSVSRWEWVILILAIVFGLVIEMANTAFEKTVDLITEDYHPKAKIAKDVSAGMMLVVSIGLSILALIIFVPHLR